MERTVENQSIGESGHRLVGGEDRMNWHALLLHHMSGNTLPQSHGSLYLVGSAVLGFVLGAVLGTLSLWWEKGSSFPVLDDLEVIAIVAIGSGAVCAAAARTARPVLYGALSGSIVWLTFFAAWQSLSNMHHSAVLHFGIGLPWGIILGFCACGVGFIKQLCMPDQPENRTNKRERFLSDAAELLQQRTQNA